MDMLQPIILAAGKGTRMQSDLPKALHTLEGKPFITWVIDAIEKSGVCKPPIIVVGFGASMVQDALGLKYTYVYQKELSGTATAVKEALPHVGDEPVLVLYCDQPFVSPDTIVKAHTLFAAENTPTLGIGTACVADFDGWRAGFMRFGRIVRDSEDIPERIVEYKEATEEERTIAEVNAGMCVVDAEWLKDALHRIEPAPVSGEYYLTELLGIARGDNKRVAVIDQSPEEAFGINSQEERTQAMSFNLQALAKGAVLS